MVERLEVVDRKNFGHGQAGDMAFEAIALGTPCESRTTHNGKDIPRGISTLGFDVGASYDFVVVCSKECEKAVRSEIVNDLARQGRAASFDLNGFGRY